MLRRQKTEFQSIQEVGQVKKRLLEIRGQCLGRDLGVLYVLCCPTKGQVKGNSSVTSDQDGQSLRKFLRVFSMHPLWLGRHGGLVLRNLGGKRLSDRSDSRAKGEAASGCRLSEACVLVL